MRNDSVQIDCALSRFVTRFRDSHPFKTPRVVDVGGKDNHAAITHLISCAGQALPLDGGRGYKGRTRCSECVVWYLLGCWFYRVHRRSASTSATQREPG